MPNQRYGAGRAQSTPTPRPVEAWAGLAVLALLGGLIAVYLGWSSHQAKAAPLDMLVGADVSGSVGTRGRQQYFAVLDESVDTVLPRGTEVELWTYDVNAHEVAQKYPRNSRDLWPVEDNMIATVSKTQGTYPSTVLEKMLASAQQAKDRGESVACLLLTDGEDFDPKTTTKLIAQLVALGNVRAMWIAGAETENGFRSVVEQKFAPFGDRLIVSSAYDAQDGINRFRDVIERK